MAKCICEMLHKMQWFLQVPDFFQANISYGYPSNHVQIVFLLFFLEARSWACLWYFLRLWARALHSLRYHLSWDCFNFISCSSSHLLLIPSFLLIVIMIGEMNNDFIVFSLIALHFQKYGWSQVNYFSYWGHYCVFVLFWQP